MSDAVVDNLYKKFGQPQRSLSDQLFHRGTAHHHPDHGSQAKLSTSTALVEAKELKRNNGHGSQADPKKMMVAVDRIAIMNNGKVIALDTPEALKRFIPCKNGVETTLEDVFLELTGKKLVVKEELVEVET